MNVDFSAFDPKLINPGNPSNIVFIKGKNTSAGQTISVRPIGRVEVMAGFVFDPILKRNRKAKAGEKARTQFLFNGIDAEGHIKTYVCGSQVIGGIKDVRDIRESSDVYVEITSTGTGLETEYQVRPAKDKTLNGKIDEPSLANIPDLAKIAASLVVELAAPSTLPPGTKPISRGDDTMSCF